MARPSLRRRLLALILALSALAWLAVGISAYLQVRHEARELFDRRLSRHEAREEIVEALGESLVWPLAAALPALALAIWLGVGSGLRPLRELREQLARRGAADLAPLDAARVPQEIEPLVQELNRLFGRIAQTLERERRLTADAAHELRTPLAVLSTQAQVARRATDDASRNEALDAMVAGAERAARLIEQMLTLARVEAGETGAAAGRFDLRETARAAMAELAGAALAKGIELELAEGPPVEAAGHAALLAVLARNLVDNAVRYTQRGGRVEVVVRAGPVLEVRDNGPGVPAPDVARLGERFHRPAGQAETGSGLGLSIVLRIAQLHGGTVRFSPGLDGRGLAVSVSFASPAGRRAAGA